MTQGFDSHYSSDYSLNWLFVTVDVCCVGLSSSFLFSLHSTRLGEGTECEAKQKGKEEKESGVGGLGRGERPGGCSGPWWELGVETTAVSDG